MLARQCGRFCWSHLMLHPCVQVRDIPAIVFGTIDHRIDTTFFKYAPDWLKVGAAISSSAAEPMSSRHMLFSPGTASRQPVLLPRRVHGTCWASVLPKHCVLISTVVAPRSTHQNKEV